MSGEFVSELHDRDDDGAGSRGLDARVVIGFLAGALAIRAGREGGARTMGRWGCAVSVDLCSGCSRGTPYASIGKIMPQTGRAENWVITQVGQFRRECRRA